MTEQVVLVDREDREIGTAPKPQVHADGTLHRAISIFVFDPSGEKMLLQQRALDKYHSGGLWSNTCCSHPRPGESSLDAAHRRLREELGFDCPLEFAFTFLYRADVGPSLIEHELDHVFVGRCEATPNPDPAEIAATRWSGVAETVVDVAAHAERYSAWFGIALRELQSRGMV
jgi:isopentenyl-diphosphate delta-isomerase